MGMGVGVVAPSPLATSLSLTSAGAIRSSPISAPRARSSTAARASAAGASPAPEDSSDVIPSTPDMTKLIKSVAWFAFWGQLVLSVVSVIILFFSAVVGGAAAAAMRFELYLTLVGITAAFVSTFRAYGYKKLGGDLRHALDVFSRSVGINILGMGASLLGLQANVGLLMAKTLSNATQNPYYAGKAANFNPVSALDVFLVQASANTLLAHFVGMVLCLWLVRKIALQIAKKERPLGAGAGGLEPARE
eukprot:CAMPEP_0182885422 /NCGR_PEP_ID=MMETSP0034_2-20130328/19596_1 /TAXON_ID=156128 /ORGANISM="Nephroselmis pyriformis, Strain CCMP717" /LENGTH=247 /DNA_ID=CAMNT_0025018689 /DNA_START=46 /DNA_END=787 /DNA_ORIENTATION=-